METEDPVRTVVQGYLEVLWLAIDHNSKWIARDVHAAFEWAAALQKCSTHDTARIAEALRPSIPPPLQQCFAPALRNPCPFLLKQFLLRDPPGPSWPLKILGSYTSACAAGTTLPELSLSHQHMSTVILELYERHVCNTLLYNHSNSSGCGSRNSTNAVALAEVHCLATAAPCWHPCPFEIALEHVKYVSMSSNESTVELARAATGILLNGAVEAATAGEGEESTVLEKKVRGEVLGMALLLATASTTTAKESKEQHLPKQALTHLNNSKNKKKVAAAAVERQLVSLIKSSPHLLITSMPPPLIAKVCRVSFQVTSQCADALDALQHEMGGAPPPPSLMHTVQHLCLFNDHVSEFFKDWLLRNKDC